MDSIYIGLMTGTSADSLDCAAVNFSKKEMNIVGLKNYDIKCFADRKNIGISFDHKYGKIDKIAAIGIKVKKWIAYHGFSININNDLIKKIMSNHSSILIIDDINDTGRTFKWIQQDWPSGCFAGHHHWNNVWGNNVRTAALIDNGASEFGEVDYTALEINKAEKDVWVVFPWEGERNYGNI